MKLFLPYLLLLCLAANAQNINGQQLESLDAEYIEMMVDNKLFSNRLNVLIDHGQPVKGLSSASERYLQDDDARVMEFNSVAHILNFLSSYGYKLQEVYKVQVREDLEEVRYVLRRGE